MSFLVTENGENGSFELAPEGTYPGRLFKAVDLGTVHGDWQGRPTSNRKILLTWELLDADARMSDGRPFSVSRRYTLSLSEKAALRAMLEAWRGKKFTSEELTNGFDIRKLVGQAGLLTISHAQKADRVYANLMSISSLPRGYTCPPAVNTPVLFDLDSFDESVFDGLSKGLQEQIMKSPEYAAYRESGPLKPTAPTPQPAATRQQPARPAQPARPTPTPQPVYDDAPFDDDVLF